MSVTGLSFNRETNPDWFRDHENLADLVRDLLERGELPADQFAYLLEKPWKWRPEWERFCRSRRAAA